MRDTAARMVEAFSRTLALPWRQTHAVRVRDAYKRFFDTEDGQIVLADLRDTYRADQIMQPGDPYLTHYNIGVDAVIRHLQTKGQVSDRAILGQIEATRAAAARAEENEE